ncbi:MAG: toxin-antitoxin system HicB family antitoxin [Vitreimonas sp.]
MSALTLRLPNDKHARLKSLARRRGTSVNRLMEEMATIVITEADAEARFAMRAARGRGKTTRGLALLRKASSKK